MRRTPSACRPFALVLFALLGCTAPTRSDAGGSSSVTPDLPLTRAPYETVHADWKERLPQRYAYVEHVGSYTATGRLLPELFAALGRAGVEPSGPPFALFFDDPGLVPVEQLRSRACFPVDAAPSESAGFALDVLPGTTVVYARVAGPYPELPRVCPGLIAFAAGMGWVVDGPVREIYLTPPETVEDFDDLRAEVQVPVGEAP